MKDRLFHHFHVQLLFVLNAMKNDRQKMIYCKDDNNSKTTGIFFHTYDSAVTDGVTIYAAPDLGGAPPVMNGLLSN